MSRSRQPDARFVGEHIDDVDAFPPQQDVLIHSRSPAIPQDRQSTFRVQLHTQHSINVQVSSPTCNNNNTISPFNSGNASSRPFPPDTSASPTSLPSPFIKDFSSSTEMNTQTTNNTQQRPLPVFGNPNTLIAHFNIPKRLPVPPRVGGSAGVSHSPAQSPMINTPMEGPGPVSVSNGEDFAQQHRPHQSSEAVQGFQALYGDYSKMLSTKPGEGCVSSSAQYVSNNSNTPSMNASGNVHIQQDSQGSAVTIVPASPCSPELTVEPAELFADTPVMNYLRQQMNHLSPNQWPSSMGMYRQPPYSQVDPAMSQNPYYLTSPIPAVTPVPDAVHAHELSPYETPFETPLEAFLNTPAIDSSGGDDFLTSPVVVTGPDGLVIDNYGPGMLLIPGASVADCDVMGLRPAVPATNAMRSELSEMIAMSPTTPALDQDLRSSPFLSPALNTFPSGDNPHVHVHVHNAHEHSPSVSTSSPNISAVELRRNEPTGTRKGLTTESLVPYDAPTQTRTYHGPPSATSRKLLPAQFERKRKRQREDEGLDSDEEDELIGESSMSALNGVGGLGEQEIKLSDKEAEAILQKRRQNTLAARRSRARKLQHQRELENKFEKMKESRDMWKMKAMIAREQLIRSGQPEPYGTEE